MKIIFYSTNGFSQNPEWQGINRKQVDSLLSLMDVVHEHLLDPIGFFDKEKTRDNLLQMQKLCGEVATNIDLLLTTPK